MEEQDSILNEFLERINKAEKRNEDLRKSIENKKKELKKFDNNTIVEKKEDKKEIPTKEQDKILGEHLLNEYKNIIFSNDIDKNMKEVTIEYITQEQYNALYIMGDFTKWELMPMKKDKDIFSFKIVLLKGFKYYYSFQAEDQILIDYNNLYEDNPKTFQIQNYIDLTSNGKEIIFDCEKDYNILEKAKKRYALSHFILNDEDVLFIDKFKRHMIASKEITNDRNEEYSQISNSIYDYYDQIFNYIKPYETDIKLQNLKLYFKDRIFVHYSGEIKEQRYMYYYKVINISDTFCFHCVKLYDNNNIKINVNYYNNASGFYTVFFEQISLEPIDVNSEFYHLLPKAESVKILTDYNNDKENVIKAYFKTLINLKNNNNNTVVQNQVPVRSIMVYVHNYGSILVKPNRVEPNRINKDDYEFQYSLNKITKVKNIKEGSFVEFIAIDETVEKAKRPFRFKIYYSIKNNKINIIHCHVLDKDLREIKMIIKEIDKNTDPHILKKSEEYIKNNELLLLVLESNPFKLYYKGKKVKMEAIKIEENKLYLLESPNTDSIFNKMYVTSCKIEDKIKYNLIEQCNEYSYSLDNIQNGVDVKVSYDNNKSFVVEQMELAVSPCLLKKLSQYEENNLKKNQIEQLKKQNINELDKYFLINQKISKLIKYNKETIDKMEQKEKESILANLKEYKESMVIILNYVESKEMWDILEEAANIAAEIEDLITLFTTK